MNLLLQNRPDAPNNSLMTSNGMQTILKNYTTALPAPLSLLLTANLLLLQHVKLHMPWRNTTSLTVNLLHFFSDLWQRSEWIVPRQSEG
jgi:hypothetical protein